MIPELPSGIVEGQGNLKVWNASTLGRFVHMPFGWFGFIDWNPVFFLVSLPGRWKGEVGLGREVRSRNSQNEDPPQEPLPYLLSEGQERLDHKIRGPVARERWLKAASLSRKRISFFFSLPYHGDQVQYFLIIISLFARNIFATGVFPPWLIKP